MARATAIWLASAAVVVVLLALLAAILSLIVTPPSSTKSPLIYPGARQVTTEQLPTATNRTGTRITFVAGASPETVIEFYTAALYAYGWQFQQSTLNPRVLSLGWFFAANPNAYQMDVQVQPGAREQTRATITLYTYSDRFAGYQYARARVISISLIVVLATHVALSWGLGLTPSLRSTLLRLLALSGAGFVLWLLLFTPIAMSFVGVDPDAPVLDRPDQVLFSQAIGQLVFLLALLLLPGLVVVVKAVVTRTRFDRIL